MQPDAWPQFISCRRSNHNGDDVFRGFSQQARGMWKDNDDEVSPYRDCAYDYYYSYVRLVSLQLQRF